MKDWMEAITLVATLVTAGWASAYIAQAIKRPAWPSWVKLVLAMVVAALIGLATAWLSGDVLGITAKWGSLTAADVLAFAAVVFTAASIWYKATFKGVPWAETVGEWPAKK